MRERDRNTSAEPSGRRSFLVAVVAAAGALLAAVGRRAPRPRIASRAAGPRERALHEADFYRPHDLAG